MIISRINTHTHIPFHIIDNCCNNFTFMNGTSNHNTRLNTLTFKISTPFFFVIIILCCMESCKRRNASHTHARTFN